MACVGRFGDGQTYARFWCMEEPLEADEIVRIELMLDLASADVHSALAAANACDCTLAGWADTYLTKLTYYEAAALYNCPCGNALDSEERKRQILEWVSEQLALIRNGEVEVCQDETGTTFPAVSWAEHNVNVWQTALIAYNKMLRG